MAQEFKYLFTPIRVGPVTLKNRIFSTGHAEALAEDGKPKGRFRRYHEAKARGGCALTIVGGSTSVHPSSPAFAWNLISNHDDSIIPDYRELAEAVHRHDCLVFSQLTHLGRRAQSDTEAWHVLLAPSQIPEKVHREIPHELEPEKIAELVRAFGDATRRCQEGGLDGVELSMAHNHLIDQFWSPLFNHRTDEYGGSLENRMRFCLEVLAEIRRQVGRDFVVGARISGDEFTDGGLTAEDMAEIARRLAASGLVDFLSIIGGGAHTFPLQAAAVPNMSFPNAVYVHLAGAIKQAVPSMPVLHATRIVDPIHAEQILAEGYVDEDLLGMDRVHDQGRMEDRHRRHRLLDRSGQMNVHGVGEAHVGHGGSLERKGMSAAPDDREEVHETRGGQPAGDLGHVLGRQAAVGELVAGDPRADHEITPHLPADLGEDLQAEPHPVLEAPPVLVGSVVEERGPELVDEVIVGHGELGAVEPTLLAAARRVHEGPDQEGGLDGVELS